jgi:DNA-binding transcriptional ArsR family regulator
MLNAGAGGESVADWDNAVYKALAHPIRRRIIESLQEKGALEFNDLLKYTSMYNHGRLGFHLRALKGLIEHDPSTKRYVLTSRGVLASELMCDIRFTMTTDTVSLNHVPTTYVRRLISTDHAILFYDTEEIKRKIAYQFLKTGLLKGDAVVYVVSEDKLDFESQEIQKYGTDSDNLHEEALTILSAEEWYLKKGKAHGKIILDNWLALLKEKQKMDFTELRVASEMEVFFNYAKTKELLAYEAMLGKQLAPALCALCLYNTHKLDEQEFIQLNHSHGHSIFKGIAFKITNS